MADNLMKRVVAVPGVVVAALRHFFRDDAYERYLVEQRRAHPDAPPLDRATFRKAQALRNLGRCCGG